jgi:hypothetical protein
MKTANQKEMKRVVVPLCRDVAAWVEKHPVFSQLSIEEKSIAASYVAEWILNDTHQITAFENDLVSTSA